MGSSTLKVRKGLGNWDAVKDAAMGSGPDSSVDISAGEAFNNTQQSGTLDFLSHRMRMQPRSQEAGVIDKLNSQIDALMEHNYGDINLAVSKFFGKVEEMARMDPSDLERMILDIQRVVYVATEVVTSLYQDAYFADRVQQDEYWSAYKTDELPSKATIGDRQAFAYDKSQDSRFYYYYSFMLWRKLNEKLMSLKDLQKTLEFSRNRMSREGKSWG